MTLGKLIDRLPNTDQSVYFDFCSAFPLLALASSRCSYENGALDWDVVRRDDRREVRPKVPTSAELRTYLISRLGQTMEGYKGGTYPIERDTEIFVDGYGECTSTAITGVVDLGWAVLIETGAD